MTIENKALNLENRRIDFAVKILHVAESLPKTKVKNHILPDNRSDPVELRLPVIVQVRM
jgi:hypothetical protein